MKPVDRIARERCEKLLTLSREICKKEPALAKRYVKLARKIAQRHRFSLGSRAFCRACSLPWVLGSTVRVRLAAGRKTALYTCRACSYTRRFPYSLARGR